MNEWNKTAEGRTGEYCEYGECCFGDGTGSGCVTMILWFTCWWTPVQLMPKWDFSAVHQASWISRFFYPSFLTKHHFWSWMNVTVLDNKISNQKYSRKYNTNISKTFHKVLIYKTKDDALFKIKTKSIWTLLCSFVLHRRKEVKIWKKMRVSNWWQNFSDLSELSLLNDTCWLIRKIIKINEKCQCLLIRFLLRHSNIFNCGINVQILFGIPEVLSEQLSQTKKD